MNNAKITVSSFQSAQRALYIIFINSHIRQVKGSIISIPPFLFLNKITVVYRYCLPPHLINWIELKLRQSPLNYYASVLPRVHLFSKSCST